MKEIAIHAVNMSARLGKYLALSGLNLSLPFGRWVSIVGPNGAGKTTLLKALAGLLPYSGELSVLGENLRNLPSRERAQQLAWLAQDETGGLDMRVKNVVMLGRLPMQGLLGSVTAKDIAACELAMLQTQTLQFKECLLGELSAGQQQRVRLARALATQAKVLLLDEPLANLDPPHQMDWQQAICEQVKRGTTVISVLHELPMALLADEMLIMQAGRIAHQGRCSDPVTHRALESVFDQRVRVLNAAGHLVVVPG